MPKGLFTSTNFEDTKGFIDEPLNLSDVAKGHSVDTPTDLSIFVKDTTKGAFYILIGNVDDVSCRQIHLIFFTSYS
ncbi:hypothetical protein QQF64_032831 [Cirrhinus molitorella]|uniref:Uncharacterized protein n=1 Tax=Cirrhinus molitorella TaxID=172907 RepID=A0ABR3MS47_9TELE